MSSLDGGDGDVQRPDREGELEINSGTSRLADALTQPTRASGTHGAWRRGNATGRVRAGPFIRGRPGQSHEQHVPAVFAENRNGLPPGQMTRSVCRRVSKRTTAWSAHSTVAIAKTRRWCFKVRGAGMGAERIPPATLALSIAKASCC